MSLFLIRYVQHRRTPRELLTERSLTRRSGSDEARPFMNGMRCGVHLGCILISLFFVFFLSHQTIFFVAMAQTSSPFSRSSPGKRLINYQTLHSIDPLFIRFFNSHLNFYFKRVCSLTYE